MKDLLLVLFVLKREFVNFLLLITTALIFCSGCSNEVLKRFTITVDCESMVGRNHNEFQADSCFRIGSKFIAFSNMDSIIINIGELCGTIDIKYNRENYDDKNQITENESLSAQKK